MATGGAAYCWGRNFDGRLGDGTFNQANSPVAVSGGLTLVRVAGAHSHTCALDGSGAAYCWGMNNNGHLGNGTTSEPSPIPGAVAGGHTFAQLSAGSQHTCGRKGTGEVFCWGLGIEGQLGVPLIVQSEGPVQTSPFE